MNPIIINVLFLCTSNSAQSIMAEALLNHCGKGRFRAFSAGSHPTETVNPYSIERLKIEGIATDGLNSKNWQQFANNDSPAIDFAITVCDVAVGETSPFWRGHPITAHSGITDPEIAAETQTFIEFAKTFAILERRISLFVNLNPVGLERMVLEEQVRAIAI